MKKLLKCIPITNSVVKHIYSFLSFMKRMDQSNSENEARCRLAVKLISFTYYISSEIQGYRLI